MDTVNDILMYTYIVCIVFAALTPCRDDLVDKKRQVYFNAALISILWPVTTPVLPVVYYLKLWRSDKVPPATSLPDDNHLLPYTSDSFRQLQQTVEPLAKNVYNITIPARGRANMPLTGPQCNSADLSAYINKCSTVSRHLINNKEN